MIRYHGTPITPEAAATQILKGRHGMVSFANPEQIGTVAEVCQSFVIDNGAFTKWRGDGGTVDIKAYLDFVEEWARHPGFAWCLIPDKIDGDEKENKAMLQEFIGGTSRMMITTPISAYVPIWHLHESLDRLQQLIFYYERIAFGSSGEWSEPGTPNWCERMDEAFEIVCDSRGRPKVKIHGLRMMDPTIFSRYPFSSVDSCNVARNIGMDASWDSFKYGSAIRKSVRGVIMAQHCEDHATASTWVKSRETQYKLLFG